jgi:hypothetical protein
VSAPRQRVAAWLPPAGRTRRPGGRVRWEATAAGRIGGGRGRGRLPRAGGGAAYELDVPALVEQLRGLSPVQLLAVVDLAERMDAAVLRGDVEGREPARREVGVAG